jgi:hypothetical protein
MPNRGLATVMDSLDRQALFLEQELEDMTTMKNAYPDLLRAWKCYTPWGDVPNASGWTFPRRNRLAGANGGHSGMYTLRLSSCLA